MTEGLAAIVIGTGVNPDWDAAERAASTYDDKVARHASKCMAMIKDAPLCYPFQVADATVYVYGGAALNPGGIPVQVAIADLDALGILEAAGFECAAHEPATSTTPGLRRYLAKRRGD